MIREVNNRWYGNWICNSCNTDIECSASSEWALKRNLKKKNICKPCSLKLQIGEGNPFYNKRHTEKTKIAISISKSGHTNSAHMSEPKYRKMFSDMKTKLWASGKMENTRLKLSELMKSRINNGEIKGYNRSKAEDEILNYLGSINIEANGNHIVEGKIFDIYIPEFNLLIEYNGDYWHCNPNKYSETYVNKKKNKSAKEIWEYDKDKLYLGKKNGYHCEVIWETDYKQNGIMIIKEIINRYDSKPLK